MVMVFSVYIDPFNPHWQEWEDLLDPLNNAGWMEWMKPKMREYAIAMVPDGYAGNRWNESSFMGVGLAIWRERQMMMRKETKRCQEITRKKWMERTLPLAMAFHWNLGYQSPLGMCPFVFFTREIIHHL